MANHTFSDLKGKVCVITGGAGIIGTAIVKALAAAGVKTVILDLRKAVAEELADTVSRESGTDCAGMESNVLDMASLNEY